MPTEREKYSKKEVVSAIQVWYGFTKKEAEQYFKNTDATMHNLLVQGFVENARRCLYED